MAKENAKVAVAGMRVINSAERYAINRATSREWQRLPQARIDKIEAVGNRVIIEYSDGYSEHFPRESVVLLYDPLPEPEQMDEGSPEGKDESAA